MTDLDAIDLNLLRTLDVLLQRHSVTEAAEELGRSQPAVSHALARLREALDDPLLVRQGRHMEPTPRAEALAPDLHRLLEDLQGLLRRDAGFDPATAERTFVLACPDMLAPVLPEVLAALGGAPAVDLELTVAAGRPPVDEADVVLGVLPERAPGVIARSLGSIHQRVALRPGHPALDEPWTPETWVAWPHVLVRTGTPGPSLVEHALAEAGLRRRVGLAVPTFLLAPHVVARSDLLFTSVGELLERLPLDLVLREPPLPLPPVRVAAMWSERFAADPGHRWFRERVVAVAAGLIEG